MTSKHADDKFTCMEYSFNENTPPKEIVAYAMLEISEAMQTEGFKFLKSKSEIVKRSENFTFRISSQSRKWNEKGVSTEIWLHCSVSDNEEKLWFWGSTLAFSNGKQGLFHSWQLYGKDNYEKSLQEIKTIIFSRLLPFFRRFEQDLQNLIDEVVENGFCVFEDTQVYDANYRIPKTFLSKYGTKAQLNIAFQHYIDRHQLEYVKPNMKKAIELLKEGKQIVNNGEKEYAEFAVKHGLNLVF